MDSSISCQEETKRVLITGFGPFSSLPENPSWEGVQAMNQEEIERKFNVRLFREQVQVKYEDIDQCIPKLWDKLKPVLTLHVGVSDATECFLLETQAGKYGYHLEDIEGCNRQYCESSPDGPETLATALDVTVLKEEFNSDPPDDSLWTEVSDDAGKYLCEYIYYTSLCRDTSRTLFIHVPFNIYTNDQIAQGLERILEICLRHLDYECF